MDGRALARHLGLAEPADPVGLARSVLASGEPAGRAALARVAQALGSGTGALVNVHDPATVTLGGLAAAFRRAAPEAFERAYLDGLMAFHRGRPPAVVDAVHGEDGPLQGAALMGLDHVTSEPALAAWAALASEGDQIR